MGEYLLYEPTKNDMKIDYPELSGYSEFENLSEREIRLCWLMGNRTSPIASYSKKKRIKVAIEQSYSRAGQNRADVKAMLQGNLPEKILMGIQRMASFRPSVRFRAKMLQEQIFDNLEELIQVSEAEKKAMDTDEKKKYADFVIKVSGDLEGMVGRMEAGFGMKAKRTDKDKVEIKTSLRNVTDRVDERS